jgi:hypothetical protein
MGRAATPGRAVALSRPAVPDSERPAAGPAGALHWLVAVHCVAFGRMRHREVARLLIALDSREELRELVLRSEKGSRLPCTAHQTGSMNNETQFQETTTASAYMQLHKAQSQGLGPKATPQLPSNTSLDMHHVHGHANQLG